MTGFQKILLAIDLDESSETLIRKVVSLYDECVSRLHVVHVIKEVAEAGAVDSDDADSRRLVDHTAIRLRETLNRNGLTLTPDRIFLLSGEPAAEIKRLAEQIRADLVIVGSQTRGNDWLRLPGATTNCVIQGIESDVMAVKV